MRYEPLLLDGRFSLADTETGTLIDFGAKLRTCAEVEAEAQKRNRRDEARKAARREASFAAYAYDGTGPLRMRRAAFYAIHPDFRSSKGDATHPSCLKLLRGRGTCLVPVEFA